MSIAGEAIELGNDELGAVESAGGESFGKLRPITALAGFNLDVFLEQPPPAAVEVVGDGGSLRRQAET